MAEQETKSTMTNLSMLGYFKVTVNGASVDWVNRAAGCRGQYNSVWVLTQSRCFPQGKSGTLEWNVPGTAEVHWKDSECNLPAVTYED